MMRSDSYLRQGYMYVISDLETGDVLYNGFTSNFEWLACTCSMNSGNTLPRRYCFAQVLITASVEAPDFSSSQTSLYTLRSLSEPFIFCNFDITGDSHDHIDKADFEAHFSHG